MRPILRVPLPQWTDGDLPPGEQAAVIAAKQRPMYAGRAAAIAREAARAAGRSSEEAEVLARAAAAAVTVEEPALWIELYTGDVYELFDNGDGRWGAKLVRSAGPEGLPVKYHGREETVTPKVGTRFVAAHGTENIPLPELTRQTIRVECGVVGVEKRVDGHDEELKALRAEVKALRQELAEVSARSAGLMTFAGRRHEHDAPERFRLSPEDVR